MNLKSHPILYFSIPFLAFYTTSILYINSISFFLKPAELFAISICAIFVPRIFLSKINKTSFVLFCCILLPVFISFFINYVFPVSVDAWSFDIALRKGGGSSRYLVETYGVSLRNITQSAYLFLGATVFLIYANVDLNIERMEKWLRISLVITIFVSVFQIISWYAGFYDVYLNTIYSGHPYVEQNLLYKTYGWYKRINSTLAEPSVFGYFLALTLATYWTINKEKSLRDPVFYVSIVIGIISTSSTFLIMMVAFYCYYLIKSKSYGLMVFIFLLLGFLTMVFFNNIVAFFLLKIPSFNERMLYTLVVPIKTFMKSPFYGVAYGTTRPLNGFLNILISFGALGSAPILFFFVRGIRKLKVGLFLIVCGIGWLTIPDFHYMFFWGYLGILLNVNNGFEKKQKITQCLQ